MFGKDWFYQADRRAKTKVFKKWIINFGGHEINTHTQTEKKYGITHPTLPHTEQNRVNVEIMFCCC